MTKPLWLLKAQEELGVHETSGKAATPRILDYWREAGLDPSVAAPAGDETPWCAIFVGAMLARAGIKPPHFTLARQFGGFGHAIATPVDGAIAVLDRPGGASWQGHTGFIVGADAGHVSLLGGNQGNAVSIANFPRSRLIAVRWPVDTFGGGHLSGSASGATNSPSDR